MRTLSSLLILSSIGLGLGACTSPEQQMQADAAACQSYGFAPGTPDFANCVQREQLTRRQGSSSSVGVGVGVGGGSFGRGGFGGGGVGFGF